MKSIKLIVLTCFLFTLTNCNKETLVPTSNFHAQLSRLSPDDLDNTMNEFITLTIENNVINAPDLEARDALLVLEAAINYHTCLPSEVFDEVIPDTFEIEMDLIKNSDGEFIYKHELLANQWPELLARSNDAVNQVNFEDPDEPFNLVIDLEFTEFQENYAEENQIGVIRAIVWVGNLSLPLLDPCYFNATDYWSATSYFGTPPNCGTNTNTNSTAIKELQRRLTSRCMEVTNCSYYSYITGWAVYPAFWQPYIGTFCSGFYLMWFDDIYYNYCLSPYELGCYVSGAKFMVTLTYPPNPTGQTLSPFLYRVRQDSGANFTHWLDMRYGKCNIYDPD